MIPKKCCLCKSEAESTHHLFIHCPWVGNFWNHFLARFGVSWVQPAFVRVLLDSWPTLFEGKGNNLANDMWSLIPAAICWWCGRKKMVEHLKTRTGLSA